jgi:hypothetical protein
VTPRVVVFTAPGCHLCGPAVDAVRSLCGDDFEVVDITIDAELERRYRARIPVVEVDGIERCRYVVDERALRSAVGTLPG